MRRRAWPVVAIVLVVCAVLPVVGQTLRADAAPRCAYDGVRLRAEHRVVVSTPDGAASLCCVSCGVSWLAAEDVRPERIDVVDETTGRLIDARDAVFVRSRVVAVPETGDPIHAFALPEDAAAHAETHRGRVLGGASSPFAEALRDR